MTRKVIKIDENLCNGCGICVDACHEAAIGLVDGKAVLLRDDYCDGLGDCLPNCPTGAISFEMKNTLAYDHGAVVENLKKMGKEVPVSAHIPKINTDGFTELTTWPVQIQLVMANASFFNGADLLVAADCCGFACGNFHSGFMAGKVTLIGCPKLDHADYAEKLTEILVLNEINSVVVTRMEVPCCGGLELAVKAACEEVGMDYDVVTFTTTGDMKSVEKNF